MRVICLPKEGNPGAGSGFVVGRGDFVVTNHHVIACTEAGGRAVVLLEAARRDMMLAQIKASDDKRVRAGHGTVTQPRSPPTCATIQP